MSYEFKEKLQKYERGELTDLEIQQVEADIEKAEVYQQFLNDMLESTGTVSESTDQLVKKGKRRSRVGNLAWTLGGLLILFIIANIITVLYFGNGDDSRIGRYSEAMQVGFAMTTPNVSARSGGTNISFPTADFEWQIMRQIGDDRLVEGRIHGGFFFSRPNISIERNINNNWTTILFPDDEDANEYQDLSGFDRLEQLPDGTMAELYLSFTELVNMAEVFERFRSRDVDLRWMGIDAGPNYWNENRVVLGIPHDGFGLNQDMEWFEEDDPVRTGLFTTTTGRSGMRVHAQPYGDIDFREGEFLNALEIMENHSNISRQFLWHHDLSDVRQYIEENGIQIVGVVITGPTTELRTFVDESWINHAMLGEVRFLNWTTHDWE